MAEKIISVNSEHLTLGEFVDKYCKGSAKITVDYNHIVHIEAEIDVSTHDIITKDFESRKMIQAGEQRYGRN